MEEVRETLGDVLDGFAAFLKEKELDKKETLNRDVDHGNILFVRLL